MLSHSRKALCPTRTVLRQRLSNSGGTTTTTVSSSSNHRAALSSLTSSSSLSTQNYSLWTNNNNNNNNKSTNQLQHSFISNNIEYHRPFSTETKNKIDNDNDNDKDNNKQQDQAEESLKDTVRKMGGKQTSHQDDNIDPRIHELKEKASSFWSSFTEEVGQAWQELLKSGERKDINKKIRHPEDTPEGDKEYTGPVEIMIIDESEHLSAWERMQKRLADAPIIQGTLLRIEMN